MTLPAKPKRTILPQGTLLDNRFSIEEFLGAGNFGALLAQRVEQPLICLRQHGRRRLVSILCPGGLRPCRLCYFEHYRAQHGET